MTGSIFAFPIYLPCGLYNSVDAMRAYTLIMAIANVEGVDNENPPSFLDRLSPDDRTAIKKMSTQRLCAKLSRIGYSEESLDDTGREELLEAWARTVVEVWI